MINFKLFFTYGHLFTPATEPMKYGLYFFIVLGLALLVSVVLYFFAKKRPIKFQRTYMRRLADSLFYLPILMILYLFIRRGQIEVASQRIILVVLLVLWLIWLLFMVYFRLVIIPKYYRVYEKKKREEKYQSGKRKN